MDFQEDKLKSLPQKVVHISSVGHELFRTFCATYFKHVICKYGLHLCIRQMFLSKAILNGFTEVYKMQTILSVCVFPGQSIHDGHYSIKIFMLLQGDSLRLQDLCTRP